MKAGMLRIAIVGTRGIPASYGGFETFAEELAVRLGAKGHEVTVYARIPWGTKKGEFTFAKGVTVVSLPAVSHKYLETILHTSFSLINARTRKFDLILLCNAANSPLLPIMWGSRIPVAVNVDGIERFRSKWNSLGKLWYLLGEHSSVWFATNIVADAEVIADYYKERYDIASTVISYGAEAKRVPAGAVLQQFNLTVKHYILYVTRLEPENNPLGVIVGYKKYCKDSLDPMPLVIVGDAPYSADYKAAMQIEAQGFNVIFTGYQFGDAYRELRTNAAIGIQATEVGGTHPALLEAMAYGNPIIANRVPEHEEVLGETGLYYDKNDFEMLGRQITTLALDPSLQQRLSISAMQRVSEHYSWDSVTQKYEELCKRLVSA